MYLSSPVLDPEHKKQPPPPSTPNQHQAYHVSQLVSNDGCYPFPVGVGGEFWVVQKRRLSVCDQTPVLHGTSIKVWNSYLICSGTKNVQWV